uniref:Uncharacterized protein n=1 Tax=Chromera velia CCMP2878 TaxID=1169474 RepID=A0A0G4HTI3_9ALVE|eukprot:Cvel_31478.t1-p1 / transcript=Cvel_31478.t1 / gene=Cvel_31478 / organism=Chromera_velia_CCMP2878 / gene_product=hypothetical protein / transcript_product=hypothetical protein / location=Cvel_scaffold4697:2552-6039(+) / protein_length=189 / sequence_SO=supercontig / SO=protein_coding / is_pseudo=false
MRQLISIRRLVVASLLMVALSIPQTTGEECFDDFTCAVAKAMSLQEEALSMGFTIPPHLIPLDLAPDSYEGRMLQTELTLQEIDIAGNITECDRDAMTLCLGADITDVNAAWPSCPARQDYLVLRERLYAEAAAGQYTTRDEEEENQLYHDLRELAEYQCDMWKCLAKCTKQENFGKVSRPLTHAGSLL